ncbi:1314_t:CDS:1, partial [Entrophospora sp. SA101]
SVFQSIIITKWKLPTNKSVEDIYHENVCNNVKLYGTKDKFSAIEKTNLRYGASRIIDLSAHMSD